MNLIITAVLLVLVTVSTRTYACSPLDLSNATSPELKIKDSASVLAGKVTAIDGPAYDVYSESSVSVIHLSILASWKIPYGEKVSVRALLRGTDLSKQSLPIVSRRNDPCGRALRTLSVGDNIILGATQGSRYKHPNKSIIYAEPYSIIDFRGLQEEEKIFGPSLPTVIQK